MIQCRCLTEIMVSVTSWLILSGFEGFLKSADVCRRLMTEKSWVQTPTMETIFQAPFIWIKADSKSRANPCQWHLVFLQQAPTLIKITSADFFLLLDFGLSRLTSLQFIQYHVAVFYKPTIPQSPPSHLRDYNIRIVGKCPGNGGKIGSRGIMCTRPIPWYFLRNNFIT